MSLSTIALHGLFSRRVMVAVVFMDTLYPMLVLKKSCGLKLFENPGYPLISEWAQCVATKKTLSIVSQSSHSSLTATRWQALLIEIAISAISAIPMFGKQPTLTTLSTVLGLMSTGCSLAKHLYRNGRVTNHLY